MLAPAKIALFVFLTALTACVVGEAPPDDTDPDPDPMPSVNQQTFTSMIQPLVTECVGCHQGSQPPNLTGFDKLTTKYTARPGADNVLVIKANTTNNVHQNVQYFSDAEKATIAAWIDGLQ